MVLFRKACIALAVLAALTAVVAYRTDDDAWRSYGCVAALAAAGGAGVIAALRHLQFTVWIIAVVIAALVNPEPFLHFGPLSFAGVSVPRIESKRPEIIQGLVQMVMFAMGTKMSPRDFAGVVRMPWPVFIGILLQYTVMPLTGFALTKIFHFEPDVAAGVILIGSCSSGLASNVMCYLAGANLPLSITLTALATVLAPIMTPFWMKTLAGASVDQSYLTMMMEIVKMTIVPIGAAMVHTYLATASSGGKRVVYSVAAASTVAWVALLALTQQGSSAAAGEGLAVLRTAAIYLCAAPAIGVGYHGLVSLVPWIDRHIHIASMAGIIYFTAVTTAAGRENLLTAGIALIAAAMIHNVVGYAAGYQVSRLCGLDRESALTVGFEVGMQNGGMAAGLASAMGKLQTLGLAAAVFSPWMNVSGSIWANFLRRRRLADSDRIPE